MPHGTGRGVDHIGKHWVQLGGRGTEGKNMGQESLLWIPWKGMGKTGRVDSLSNLSSSWGIRATLLVWYPAVG